MYFLLSLIQCYVLVTMFQLPFTWSISSKFQIKIICQFCQLLLERSNVHVHNEFILYKFFFSFFPRSFYVPPSFPLHKSLITKTYTTKRFILFEIKKKYKVFSIQFSVFFSWKKFRSLFWPEYKLLWEARASELLPSNMIWNCLFFLPFFPHFLIWINENFHYFYDWRPKYHSHFSLLATVYRIVVFAWIIETYEMLIMFLMFCIQLFFDWIDGQWFHIIRHTSIVYSLW